MTSRFEIWNNVHRAMTPLAHWYALIDNDAILDIQNKATHKVLHNRSCHIKWAPMHEQVTMLQKLLSHIFEQYADVHVPPRHNTEQRLEQGLCQIRRVLFPSEIEPEDELMPLDGIGLEDESVYIPNDSPDWLNEPSPDRHLCIHDEHQDGCDHFRAPPRLDPTVTYDNPSSFMSLQDLEDMNILADIEFSSDDELPDLI